MKKIVEKGLIACFIGFIFISKTEAQTESAIIDGKARFTVITPTLIRMEFSGDSIFEDRPSFNAINRNLPAVPFSTQVRDGWREIQTDKLLLRYLQNSGSFSDSNLFVSFSVNNSPLTVAPWSGTNNLSLFNHICEAENAMLIGGAAIATDHNGYTGSGFVAGLCQTGAKIEWNLNNNLSAGNYTIAIRYSNGLGGDNQHIPRTISLYIDSVKTQISLDMTDTWDNWNIFKKDVFFSQGVHNITLSCDQGDTYNVNIDWLAVIPVGGVLPVPDPVKTRTNLGGWYRGLDGQSGKIPLTDGLLSKDGWYLINDSETAIDSTGWPVPRISHAGGYQDGLFFGYGHDYKRALSDFYKITGKSSVIAQMGLRNMVLAILCL